MSAKPHVSIRVTRRYAAAPEGVFDAWLNPSTARRFLFTTAAGQVVRADIQPWVGGDFRIVDRRDGVDVSHAGEYLDIDRPRHLAFEFSVDKADRSRVAIDIAPAGTGSELTLTHELHPDWADFASRAEDGWRKILERLAAAL